MVSGFAFASSALYRTRPEDGTYSLTDSKLTKRFLQMLALANGGTRFCAFRYTEHVQDGCATTSKPFDAKPLHQFEDFLPDLK